MNDTSKVAVAAGTGLILGKMTGGNVWYWLLLGGAATIFMLNSPQTRSSISSAVRKK
jgi:hypothetical protein